MQAPTFKLVMQPTSRSGFAVALVVGVAGALGAPLVLVSKVTGVLGLSPLIAVLVLLLCFLAALIGSDTILMTGLSQTARGLSTVGDARRRAFGCARPQSQLGDDADRNYVGRDIDDALRGALGFGGRLVVIYGPPHAGKSRAAFQAIRCVTKREDDAWILAPPTEAAELRSMLVDRVLPRRKRRRWVLFLDDLEEYLVAGGLTQSSLDAFSQRSGGALLIGTMSDDAYWRLKDEKPEGHSAAAQVLTNAIPIELESSLSPPEISRAHEIAQYGRLGDRLVDLPRALIGSDADGDTMAALQLQYPTAAKLVLAAADWRRAGLPGGAPEAFLREAVEVDEDGFAAALGRATSGPQALLRKRTGPAYKVSSIVAHDRDAEQAKLPISLLSYLRHAAHQSGRPAVGPSSAAVVLARGFAARGQSEAAAEALKFAKEYGDPTVRAAVASAELAAGDDPDEARARILAAADGLTGPSTIVAPAPNEEQRAFVQRLEAVQEPPFDPALPTDQERWVVRTYRHVLRRAALRLLVLLLLDATGLMAAVAATLGVASLVSVGAGLTIDRLADAATAAVPVTLTIFALAGLYEADRERARLAVIAPAMLLSALTTVTLLVLSDVALGEGFALWCSFGLAVVVIWSLRATYDWVSRAWVKHFELEVRLLLLGEHSDCLWAAEALAETNRRPTQLVGYLVPPGQDGGTGCLGTYDDLVEVLYGAFVQRCAVVDYDLSTEELAELVRVCHAEGLAVDVLPDASEMILGYGRGVAAEMPLFAVRPLTLSVEARALKRTFDLAVVVTAGGMAALLCAMYWIYRWAWRHDREVVVKDHRALRGGRAAFSMYRLKTRTRDEHGVVAGKPQGFWEAVVERFGIDELPQLVNVFRGEMTVVGPRPKGPAEVRRMDDSDRDVLVADPGITGPIQVSRRRRISLRDQLLIELGYVVNWSLFRDFTIMLQTIAAISTGRRWRGETEIVAGLE